MSRFSWLHFSDLLFGSHGSRLMRPEFREAFETDLRRLHEKTGPWDVVFLTGNLTQTGSPREFALLNSTLSSLWDYFRSLGSDPLLLTVPGESDFAAGETIADQVITNTILRLPSLPPRPRRAFTVRSSLTPSGLLNGGACIPLLPSCGVASFLATSPRRCGQEAGNRGHGSQLRLRSRDRQPGKPSTDRRRASRGRRRRGPPLMGPAA